MASCKRELEIDLSQVDEEPNLADMVQTVPFPNAAFATGYEAMTPDAMQYGIVSADGTPTYGTPLIMATPPYVATPNYATPTYATPIYCSPQAFQTPVFYGDESPLFSLMTPPYVETPVSYEYIPEPQYEQRGAVKQHQFRGGMKVSRQVQAVLKRIRQLCVKRNITMADFIEGENILKVSARTAAHCQKLEKVIDQIVEDKVLLNMVSLPPTIDTTKRKRGFLFFVKLKNFEKDEQKVRARFNETGLDYKIKVVNVDSQTAKAKSQEINAKQGQSLSMDMLLQQVEALKVQIETLKLQETLQPQTQKNVATQ